YVIRPSSLSPHASPLITDRKYFGHNTRVSNSHTYSLNRDSRILKPKISQDSTVSAPAEVCFYVGMNS
ncbi:unnamed protein product, partial [Candidula unifasciata]